MSASDTADLAALPEGWAWRPLSELAKTSSGGTPKRSQKQYYKGGTIPWVKISDLADGPVTSTEECITEEGLADSSARLLPAGTLLLAMYGSIGKLGVLEIEATTNQAICAIRPDDDLLSRDYLFWYLMSQRQILLASGYGGTQDNISQTFLKTLMIPVPPREEQASILDLVKGWLDTLGHADQVLSEAQERSRLLRLSVFHAAFTGQLDEAV